MNYEIKEEYIEIEILCYLMEKWLRAYWKNDIKWYYNEKLWAYQKNKSNFIRNWISDISFLKDWKFICIEVKRPSEIKFFDKDIKVLREDYIRAQLSWKSSKTIKRYLHAVEQREFLNDIISEGWVWFFACSLDQVIERLNINWINL